jgi:hypothetical protein
MGVGRLMDDFGEVIERIAALVFHGGVGGRSESIWIDDAEWHVKNKADGGILNRRESIARIARS